MTMTPLFHESALDFGVVVCENDTLCTCILSAPAWLCQAVPGVPRRNLKAAGGTPEKRRWSVEHSWLSDRHAYRTGLDARLWNWFASCVQSFDMEFNGLADQFF